MVITVHETSTATNKVSETVGSVGVFFDTDASFISGSVKTAAKEYSRLTTRDTRGIQPSLTVYVFV